MIKTIKVFGDSHSVYFKSNNKFISHAPWARGLHTVVTDVHGASIVGLGKERSKLNVKKIVGDSLVKSDISVFAFGQVDLELGFYYRKIIKGEHDLSYSDFNNMLINEYESFLKTINSDKIIIKGVNATVLKYQSFAVSYVSRIISENETDPVKIKAYKKQLNEKMLPFSDRHNAGLDLNVKLKEMALKNGWLYFDINSYLTNFSLGKGIDDRFIPAGYDHHIIDSIEVRKIHFTKLKEMV